MGEVGDGRERAAGGRRRSNLVAGVAAALVGAVVGWNVTAGAGTTGGGRDAGAPVATAAPAAPEGTAAPGGAVTTVVAGDAPADGAPSGAAPGRDVTEPSGERALRETFDGEPTSPAPWDPDDWDVTVHSRDRSTWDALEPMDAEHGPACEPPTTTHVVTAYDDAVFRCRDHLMTAINAEGYGMIYLTPDRMVDLSAGEAVVSFDVSTFRSSARDWWDVWITPYDDQLQLPLDLGTDVDASGPPRRSIRVGLDPDNALEAELYDDFDRVDVGGDRPGQLPSTWWVGYESFLQPDRARRDTVEIRLSRTHLRVGMPAYGTWWIDTDLPELDWDRGVVQLGHHSYNPTKDCNVANTPKPPVETCAPSTWHWDDVRIEPAVPFSITRSTPRAVEAPERPADEPAPTADVPSGPTEGERPLRFDRPAPEGAMLRFAGIGTDLEVSFDGGAWEPAQRQATDEPTKEEHFASYWTPVPEGTTSVAVRGSDWFGGPWRVRDATFWAAP